MSFVRFISFKAAPVFLALLFLLSACQPKVVTPTAESTSLPLATVTPVLLVEETAEEEPKDLQPPEKTAIIMLTLSDAKIQSGEEFVLGVVVDTGGQEVDTVQISLNYDPNLLEVIDLQPGKVFDTQLLSMFDNKTGTLDYAAGLLGGRQSGELQVVQVKFKALAQTPVSIPLTFNFGIPRETGVFLVGYSVLKDDGAQDILIPVIAAAE